MTIIFVRRAVTATFAVGIAVFGCLPSPLDERDDSGKACASQPDCPVHLACREGACRHRCSPTVPCNDLYAYYWKRLGGTNESFQCVDGACMRVGTLLRRDFPPVASNVVVDDRAAYYVGAAANGGAGLYALPLDGSAPVSAPLGNVSTSNSALVRVGDAVYVHEADKLSRARLPLVDGATLDTLATGVTRMFDTASTSAIYYVTVSGPIGVLVLYDIATGTTSETTLESSSVQSILEVVERGGRMIVFRRSSSSGRIELDAWERGKPLAALGITLQQSNLTRPLLLGTKLTYVGGNSPYDTAIYQIDLGAKQPVATLLRTFTSYGPLSYADGFAYVAEGQNPQSSASVLTRISLDDGASTRIADIGQDYWTIFTAGSFVYWAGAGYNYTGTSLNRLAKP